MPRRYTMATLVTRCKRRADRENDDHIAAAEWKALIHEVYGELWSIVKDAGHRYFETSTTVTATGATSYTEPTGHFATIAITRVEGSYEYVLRQLRPEDEISMKGLTGSASRWTLVDDQLFLYPKPSSGSYKWYYQQQPTDLASYADADVVDTVSPSGEAFLIWGVTVLALSKGEGDLRFAISERERQRERLQCDAASRNFPEPLTRGAWIYDEDGAVEPGGWPR